MAAPLDVALHAQGDLLDRFLGYVTEKGVELYPAQEEAILELYSGKNVILNTPTGSGKSLVATALHFQSIAEGKRSFYTSPIKALVNEKFLALCREFGPERVGMITGDASVNPDAPIICCTAEIVSNDALRFGAGAKMDDVVMDEFHYYSDRSRGVAWQIPLLALPNTRFLLMSATLGDTDLFEKGLTELNGRETVVVRSTHRPVPLDFQYSEYPLHEEVQKLLHSGRAPIYLVQFTQRECAEAAQDFLSLDFCSKEEKKVIAEALEGTRFTSPYGKDIQRLLRHGIGLHHAGLLPKYRILVEKLAQRGLLKIIFGTDTLGVGVNIPIRTVLFTKLCKFDGEKTTLLSVRDFQQISGRAGRKGFDDQGTVVVQAPEHVIDNLANERKAAGDAKKQKKLVKKKPPEKGFLMWTEETYRKLVTGQPEALVSRFQVTHGMLLNVLSRTNDSDPCRSMRDLVLKSHESERAKKQHGRRAWQLFRSLVERDLVQLNPLRVNVDLQQDFSLNQALSLFVIDSVKLLDATAPDYALDLLTLVESILENPDLILRKQVDRAKTDKMAELKAQGMEFDDRIAELEKVEHPKPNREFLYDTFNEFSRVHPWVGEDNIRPKSIAREMYETFQSFSEYIRDYELQRAEGLLLRYLTEVYKALVQTVPDYAKTDEIFEMEVYLGSLVRGIDSSLLDEWERLRNPDFVGTAELADEGEKDAAERALLAEDITRNPRSFTVLVRNAVFALVRAIHTQQWAEAAELSEGMTSDGIAAAIEPFYVDHQRIRTDTRARAATNTRITTGALEWAVSQVLADPDDHNDWSIDVRVDLARSREMRRPVLLLDKIGPI